MRLWNGNIPRSPLSSAPSRATTAASLVLWTTLALATLAALAAQPAAAGAARPLAGDEPVGIRVDNISTGEIERLEQEGFDVAFRGADYVELLARPGDTGRLERMGYTWRLLGRDLFPGARSVSDEGNLDPQYHTYQEMLDELTLLATTHPNICQMYEIGDAESRIWWWDNYTYQYDIWAVRISDNPSIDEPEPCIVYDGRHHAREPVGTEISLAVARYFCENYGVDPEITQVVNSSEIWVVPMINPDGHQWVESVDPWWRKNLFDHDTDHHVDDYEGIDLNRNYDWHWEAGSWNSETYGGPYAFRAPETTALRDLCLEHRPAINPTYHSYGRQVLYPFGYGVLAEPAVLDIATEYAGRISYTPMQSTTPTGSSKDYFYGVIGTAGFTVETATDFIPSGTSMLAEVQQLLPGSIWLAKRLWGPSIQGTVTDSIAGIPLAATIHIPEIMEVYGQGELWDMQTEASTGYYCRVRPAAQQTITLMVSADGYFGKTVRVTTGGTTATVLNIQLVPESFDRGIVQGTVTNATAGGAPVPNATVTVIGAGVSVPTNASGFYSGYVAPGSYRLAVHHESFAPDTSDYVPVVIGEITTVDFSLVDIAGPAITNTTQYPNTEDPVGPYEIETTITDMSPLAEKTLFYRVGTQPFQALPMASVGLNRFQADIPGQPLGSVIQYYVFATDLGGNQSADPPEAPSELYMFRVSPFVVVFEDAMETGQGNWLHAAVTSGYVDQWHISTQRNHTPGGTTSWKCGAAGTGTYANLLDGGLESPSFTLGESGELTLWHWIEAEASSSYPTQAYDGGLVEISVEGGPWTQIVPEGGYTHTIRASSQPGPFPAGTPIFSGAITWNEVTFDLSAYENVEARVRFRFGSDGNTGREGWYIDDVLVRSMNPASGVEEQPLSLAPLRCTRLLCSPSPCLAGVGAGVRYELSRPAPVVVRVFDAAGRQVSVLTAGQAQAAGSIWWDGRDAAGRPVGSGMYLLRLDAAGQSLIGRKVMLLAR